MNSPPLCHASAWKDRPLAESSRPNRLVFVNLIRAFSMLYIVGFWHMLEYQVTLTLDNAVTYQIAILALASFVTISGYVLGVKSASAEENTIDFYKRRFWRIYPPFVVAALLYRLLTIDYGHNLVKALDLMAMFDTPAPPTLWFVSMIMVFYLAVPFLLMLRHSPVLLTDATLLLILGLIVYQHFTGLLDERIVIYLPCFVAGLYCGSTSYRGSTKAIVILLVAAAISTALMLSHRADPSLDTTISVVFALTASLLVLFLGQSLEHRLKAGPVVSFISMGSYFAYLLHRPLYSVLAHAWPFGNGIPKLFFLLCVALPLIILTAGFAQREYDALMRQLGLQMKHA
jgi:peptidoglycan/LPS O-acetylase OafA/YrhL